MDVNEYRYFIPSSCNLINKADELYREQQLQAAKL